MRTFRAATLNIWSRFGPWEERLLSIREGLRTLAPDVIGLQEVLRFGELDQARLVSQGLGYDVAWGEASENLGLRPNHPDRMSGSALRASNFGYPVGNAILSRWPIERTEVIALPDGGTDERRALLYAELVAPFGKVPFFCTHLNWRFPDGHVRVLQVKAIAAAVERLAPVGAAFPPVLVGDFNADPDADEIRYLKGLTGLGGRYVYFADAFGVAGDGTPGTTFSKKNPFAEPMREPERRIDYVFVRGPDDAQRGEPTDSRVCFDQPYEGIFPSDHFGVIATITAGR